MDKKLLFWTMRDGRKIRIVNMEDSHLLNTIAMLVRMASAKKSADLCCYPSFNGEMAQMYAEQSWDALNEMSDIEYAQENFPVFNALTAEAKRRRL